MNRLGMEVTGIKRKGERGDEDNDKSSNVYTHVELWGIRGNSSVLFFRKLLNDPVM